MNISNLLHQEIEFKSFLIYTDSLQLHEKVFHSSIPSQTLQNFPSPHPLSKHSHPLPFSFDIYNSYKSLLNYLAFSPHYVKFYHTTLLAAYPTDHYPHRPIALACLAPRHSVLMAGRVSNYEQLLTFLAAPDTATACEMIVHYLF